MPSSRPLVIHGPAGSGKTTLLAEAARRLEAGRSDADLVIRFAGETASSSSLRTLLLSLCTQLSRSYGFDESSFPVDEDELRAEFTELVELSSAKRPPVIFVDGPDQLQTRDGTDALSWIPSEIPQHARLVISVRPGPGLEALAKRLPASHFVALEPISRAEGAHILDGWLSDAGRTLQASQRDAVLGSFEARGLPLQLRLAFEQARRWSSSDSPPHLAEDVGSLVSQLMEQLSEEGNHGSVLVERSTGYLAAARRGLTEDELVDLLSADPAVMDDFRRRSPRSPVVDRIPMVVWSRSFLDLGPWLREGTVDDTRVLAIQSREIRAHVEDTYLAGSERLLRHRAIAEYFAAQPNYFDRDNRAAPNLRKLSGLPYHQAHGQLWEDLQHTLTDFGFLQARHRAVGVEALLEDFESVLAAGYPGVVLQAIRDALRLSAHALRSDPAQLGSQLIMRLAGVR